MISFEDFREKQKNDGLNSASISVMRIVLKNASEGLAKKGDDQLAKQLAEFSEALPRISSA